MSVKGMIKMKTRIDSIKNKVQKNDSKNNQLLRNGEHQFGWLRLGGTG